MSALSIPLSHPDAEEMSERFDEVRPWIRSLEEDSREVKGHGYEIIWSEINNRRIGKNKVPSHASFPTEADAFRLIGKTREAARFSAPMEAKLIRFPTLRNWARAKPLQSSI
jgi:hypothetical protein